MHFTTTPVLHRVLTVNANRSESLKMAVLLGTGLGILIVYHVVTDELLMHSISFVGSVAVIGFRTAQLVNARTKVDSVARRQIWGIVRFGAGSFAANSIDFVLFTDSTGSHFQCWILGLVD